MRILHATIPSFLFGSLLCLPSAAGAAPPDQASSELHCQLGTTLGLGSFVRAKMQCIDNCAKSDFTAGEPVSCTPPYEGAIAACVGTAEGDAAAVMEAACIKDCPECYSGGDCSADADQRVADAEAHVDALAAGVFCDDSASADGLTLAEFKCQRTTRKFLAQFWAAKLRCYAKCRKAEATGKVEAGSCEVPASDPKTQECISKAEEKAIFLIDNKCDGSLNPGADEPECAPYDTRAGTDWVAAEEAEIDSRVPALFCADPAPTTTTTMLP